MRILLAEDERRMAAALIALLKQERYDVDHVEDGVSALMAMESDMYDIAVLDVMMPEMNGFEVTRQARRKGIKTPILILTAKSQLDDKSFRENADFVIDNSSSLDEMAAQIDIKLGEWEK